MMSLPPNYLADHQRQGFIRANSSYNTAIPSPQSPSKVNPRLSLMQNAALSPSDFTRLGLASLEARMAQELMVARMQQARQFGALRLPFAGLPGQSSLPSLQSHIHPMGLPPRSSVATPHSTVPGSQGLDLLRNTSVGLSDNSETSKITTGTEPREGRAYIDEIREFDVLCGRGGRSNHHAGNKRYRAVIAEMKQAYRCTDAKSFKTDLSRAIVDHVCRYGGRFIKKDESVGKYYILTLAEARKKTSQALRETKQLKWVS